MFVILMSTNEEKIIHLLNTVIVLNDEIERLRCCDRNYIVKKRLSYALEISTHIPRRMGGNRCERFKARVAQKKFENIEQMKEFDKRYNITSDEKEICTNYVCFPTYLK